MLMASPPCFTYTNASQVLTLIRVTGKAYYNKLLASTPKVSVGLGWSLHICISNKFSGNADDVGLSCIWESIWESLL
jgi:hypothetical protein